MASPFTVELEMRQDPTEAQAQAAASLAEPARTVGLRLTNQRAGELHYKPRVQFPFLLMLWHYLSREQMTVRFAPSGDGGTRMTISGAVARERHPLTSDPEHWTEALRGSVVATS